MCRGALFESPPQVEVVIAEVDQMSATRDQGQKYGFFYQNLYELYRKSADQNQETPVHDGPAVLKVGTVALDASESSPESEATPLEAGTEPTFASLKENLVKLQELHVRLRAMLEELEEVVVSDDDSGTK